MEPKVVPTPSILTRSPFNDDFVRLQQKVYPSLGLSEKYMEREIEKVKHRGMKIDNYILHTKMYDKSVQFYKYVIGLRKTTYMTAPHFTLGLQGNCDGYGHVIKNEAPVTPLYLGLCTGEKAEKYQEHANHLKALVNKRMIEDDFQFHPVQANTELVIPQNSVYFVFTVSHSKFTQELRVTTCDDSYASCSSTTMDTTASPADPSIPPKREGTFKKTAQKIEGTFLKKKNKMLEKEIKDLQKKMKKQDKEMAMLKKTHEKEAKELRKKNELLNSQVVELRSKLEQAKNALKL